MIFRIHCIDQSKLNLFNPSRDFMWVENQQLMRISSRQGRNGYNHLLSTSR